MKIEKTANLVNLTISTDIKLLDVFQLRIIPACPTLFFRRPRERKCGHIHCAGVRGRNWKRSHWSHNSKQFNLLYCNRDCLDESSQEETWWPCIEAPANRDLISGGWTILRWVSNSWTEVKTTHLIQRIWTAKFQLMRGKIAAYIKNPRFNFLGRPATMSCRSGTC